MLLSRANLDRLEEEPKLKRIKDYVQDQKDHFPYYKSPGTVSIPESCINDGSENDEILSASISEIIRRRYHKASSSIYQGSREEVSPHEKARSNGYQNESNQRKGHCRMKGEQENDSYASQLVQKRKKMKPDELTKVPDVSSSKLLPQSKSNAFHLLQKFVSPNLEINRITMKSNHPRPKLGLFNKGKSSANGKTVPDLVFSESQFLRPQKQLQVSPQTPETSSSTFGTTRPRQPSISRFFPPKSNENKRSSLSNDHKQSRLSISRSVSPRKPLLLPVDTTQNRSTFIPSIVNRAQGIQELFSQQQRKSSASARQDQSSVQQRNDQDHPTVPYNKSTCSSSSIESIRRLLRECREPPGSYCTSNTYHPYENQQQVPHYSHARSPPYDDNTRPFATMSDYLKPWSPKFALHNPDNATLHSNQPFLEEDDGDSSENPPVQKDTTGDSIFGLNWQVVGSVTSFNPANDYLDKQQWEKDDLDLILESSPIHMVNRSNEQDDNNLKNFWLTQSYKRKL